MTLIKKEDVPNRSDCFDEDEHPVYDPRKVEWWVADDERTILCGNPEDPEIVCSVGGGTDMAGIENRTNDVEKADKLTTLTAIHIVNLHNQTH